MSADSSALEALESLERLERAAPEAGGDAPEPDVQPAATAEAETE